MNITITNVNIDMMGNTITGETFDIPSGPMSWAELTDADMCLNRELNPELFAFELLAYCQIRVIHPA